MLPSATTAGVAPFTLTVYGTNFVSGAAVQWGGSNRTTSYVNSSQLTAQITAADVARAGSAPVTVVNPLPGGGTSDATNFTINAQVSCPNGSSNGLSVCISDQSGIPRLVVNGIPTPPLVFFGVISNETPQSQLALVMQEVGYASANGVHIYKVSTDIPWTGTDYSWVDPVVAFYVNADPSAKVILQFNATVADELGTFTVPAGNDYLYADGTTSPMSKASDFYFNGYQTAVVNAINHFESGPYAGNIIAYWICADATGEWFDPNYRTKGPDYSAVNVAAFQQWLTHIYGTDAVLASAWGQSVTLATAAVPVAPAGRFPMAGVTAGQQINAFYTPASQQNWVDYSSYVSDLNTSRVLQIAQAAKQAMQSHKLVGLYFGYMFDLPGSFSGHQDIFPILNSPDVDILAAPISYINPTDRLLGGAGGAMSALDSIALHGKLWMNEDDLYTWLAADSGLPQPNSTNGVPPTQGFADTNSILQRNLATALVHRAGTWWMDLNTDGAFDSANLWEIMSQYGLALFNDAYNTPVLFTPDVAVLVDETSVFYQQNDWDFLYQSRAELRNTIVKTGTTVGFYYLSDFISGASPPAKVYFFANSGYLTDSQVTAIRARLGNEGATAIWQHAPAFLGGSVAGAAGTGLLIGMTTTEMDDPDYTTGAGFLQGLQFGFGGTQNTLVPRLLVNDGGATTLGTWTVGGGVSVAQKTTGGFTSIFFGDLALGNPDLLRDVFAAAGVHIWLTTDDVFLCDGRHLVIHAATAGTKSITLPSPLVDASTGLSTISLSMQVGDTQFFILR